MKKKKTVFTGKLFSPQALPAKRPAELAHEEYGLSLYHASAWHEIGHVLANYAVGRKCSKVELTGIGFGTAHFDPKHTVECPKELLVAAMGTAAQLLYLR
jgi:hypothetical protein